MKTNEEHFVSGIEFLTRSGDLVANDARRDILFDPQTSGGLLISVAAEAADRLMAEPDKGRNYGQCSSGTVEPAGGPTAEDPLILAFARKTAPRRCTGTPGTLRTVTHPGTFVFRVIRLIVC